LDLVPWDRKGDARREEVVENMPHRDVHQRKKYVCGKLNRVFVGDSRF
jgi:hypothetical protein